MFIYNYVRMEGKSFRNIHINLHEPEVAIKVVRQLLMTNNHTVPHTQIYISPPDTDLQTPTHATKHPWKALQHVNM